MVGEKGLSGEVADRIGEYVKLHGRRDLLDRLGKDGCLTAAKDARDGLEDMKLLLEYCDLFGVLCNVRVYMYIHICTHVYVCVCVCACAGVI